MALSPRSRRLSRAVNTDFAFDQGFAVHVMLATAEHKTFTAGGDNMGQVEFGRAGGVDLSAVFFGAHLW